jgi:phosphatidylglycerophosphate synthase
VGTAILLATAGDDAPAALTEFAGETLLGRLTRQLHELGVSSIVVLTRPAWVAVVQHHAHGEVVESDSPAGDLAAVERVAGAAAGSLLIAYGDIAVHREALAGLIADPRVSTAMLAGGKRRTAFRVQSRRGRLMSAASPYHTVRRPNASFLGVVRVGPGELGTLAESARRLAPLVTDVPDAWERELKRKAGIWRAAAAGSELAQGDDFAAPEEEESFEDQPEEEATAGVALSEEDERRVRARLAAAREDVAALLLVGLVRSGATVNTVYLRRMLWARPLSPEAAAAAAATLGDYDEDKVLLDSAVKGADGFFTTFFVSPYSKYLARWAARRGLTPNQVTVASMAIGVLAAAAFATGERWGLIAGAILLQISFTADCVDGQLARYTRNFSKLGAWLDSIFDRSKEYLAFAGLAIGASRAGDSVWLLACATITLQTVRHMSDFAYMSVRAQTTLKVTGPALEQPLDAAGVAAEQQRAAPEAPRSLATRVLALWRRTDRSNPMRWIKRMIAFPIGERFAVISITAALFEPRVTFVALLAWGGLAFLYMHAGRVLRSFR